MQSRFLIYTIVIALSVAAIAGVVQLGETLAPERRQCRRRHVRRTGGGCSRDGLSVGPLALLIVQLLVIVLATQVAGAIASTARASRPSSARLPPD